MKREKKVKNYAPTPGVGRGRNAKPRDCGALKERSTDGADWRPYPVGWLRTLVTRSTINKNHHVKINLIFKIVIDFFSPST